MVLHALLVQLSHTIALMRALRLLPFLVVLATLNVSAAPRVRIQPADPTTVDPVTLIVEQFDSCPPRPEVTRSGFTITVKLGFGVCLSPPALITHRIDLGPLPAGTYTVQEVTGNPDYAFTFTVLDAESSVEVTPSTGRITGGNTAEVFAEVNNCAGVTTCPGPTITFNGIPATVLSRIDANHFRVTVPPGTAGAAEVRVTSSGTTKSSYAYRYYDPAAAATPELFEKVLVPVFYNGPGVNGSSWATEVAVQNTNPYAVEFYRGPDAMPAIAAGATERVGFQPAPGGVFMIVPRGQAQGLRFNAMIRDVSRPMQAWGTELPIVRESRFRTDLTLLNVPVYPGYRSMLRIYSLGSVPVFGGVHFYSMDDGRTLRDTSFVLASPEPCVSVESCSSNRPAYVALPSVIDALPVTSASERVGVRITSNEPVWAFITITNNETQHAAIISPQ